MPLNDCSGKSATRQQMLMANDLVGNIFDNRPATHEQPITGKRASWLTVPILSLRLANMKDVRIKKEQLVQIVKKNRQEHREIFLKAQEKYREVAIALLDRQLKAAREGKPFMLAEFIHLVQPEDHSQDYDRALRMLELEVDDVVTLTMPEFANLVQDQWNWSRQWATNTSRYTDSPKFRAAMEQ
jgi:hypothetical protein